VYIHRNAVERGLVPAPELWRWSSYRAFAGLEEGAVKLNWQQPRTTKTKASDGVDDSLSAHPLLPTLRKARRVGHPLFRCVDKEQNRTVQDEGRAPGSPFSPSNSMPSDSVNARFTVSKLASGGSSARARASRA
jgi:hypothetical protein